MQVRCTILCVQSNLVATPSELLGHMSPTGCVNVLTFLSDRYCINDSHHKRSKQSALLTKKQNKTKQNKTAREEILWTLRVAAVSLYHYTVYTFCLDRILLLWLYFTEGNKAVFACKMMLL